MKTLLETLLAIARDAAHLISGVYATQFTVDYKSPRDPVTDADRRANDLSCTRLAREFPGVPIVAEESDPSTFSGFSVAPRIFFVDPLDGTREFVEKNGEFAVMIGLVDAARAAAGVIFAPASRIGWAGSGDDGAWTIGPNGDRAPIRTSEVADLSRARVVASRSHRTEALEQALSLLGVRELVTLGSAGLKGAEVATGRAEAYVAPGFAGQRWDACAADAIVTAAGGRFTDAFGSPIDYRHSSLGNDKGLLASNARVHEQILRRLEPVRGRQPQ